MEQLVNKVEIVFEKESAIFHDGDHVTGMLLIDNNEDIAYKCKFYFFCHYLYHCSQVTPKYYLVYLVTL